MKVKNIGNNIPAKEEIKILLKNFKVDKNKKSQYLLREIS